MSYRYQKLLPTQIRLLRVEEGAGDRDLRFSVKTFFRHIAPTYIAISYSWGNGTANKPVYLDSQQHLIRPNLWWCLYYLRKHPRWTYFWVDFVCINQQNVLERNDQVKLMDQTFSNAEIVVAWLGLEYHPHTWDSYEPMESLSFSWDVQMLIMDFANRPYWTRMWVVQELLLARDVQIVCGGHLVPWKHFKAMLEEAITINGQDDLSISAGYEKFAALPFVVTRDPGDYQSLHELLLRYKDSGCKDPRDKVFAVLSLLRNEERKALGMFFPDYSLTEEDFLVLTLAHIQQYCKRSLSIDSSELFEALAVPSNYRRQELLTAATLVDLHDEAVELPHGTLQLILRNVGEVERSPKAYERLKSPPRSQQILNVLSELCSISERLSTWVKARSSILDDFTIRRSRPKYKERHEDPLFTSMGWVKIKDMSHIIPVDAPDSAETLRHGPNRPKARRNFSTTSVESIYFAFAVPRPRVDYSPVQEEGFMKRSTALISAENNTDRILNDSFCTEALRDSIDVEVYASTSSIGSGQHSQCNILQCEARGFRPSIPSLHRY